ncbi:MAG: CHAT domain-containing protein, partial [Ktedonobacteraceae bacterium]
MANVALIEYFTTASDTLVFLLKKGQAEPLIIKPEQAITKADLLQCAERLILDFHGLPPGWDDSATYDHFKDLLSLPPSVNAGRRSKAVLQLNLKKPTFSYELKYWQRFSDQLLPAQLKAQLVDCELLCFVPHGPLHSLPFAALRWSEDEYLIEHFGICTVPSASVLRYCYSKNRRRRTGTERKYEPERCLIVAVAANEDEDPRVFEADGNTLATLFQARDAHASVTALVGTRATGSDHPASKAALQQAVAGQDVIHLACHGLFGLEGNSSDPLASGLLVSNGESSPKLNQVQQLSPAELSAHFLTAREVFRLHLEADLVTLRACSSGRVVVETGDELLGL